MQARRLTATLFAAALLAAGCSASTEETSTLPPAPPVDETIDTAAAFPDDGLTRFVITPIAGDAPAAEDDASAAEGTEGVGKGESSGDADQSGGQGEASRYLTAELLALVPDDAPLIQRDGEIGYLDDTGTFIALPIADGTGSDDIDPQPAADQTPPDQDVEDGDEVAMVSYGHPYVDELATDPAVESVVVVGDGTYGVTVSDPSVIDPAVFAIAEDVPFGHTAELYEGYQWALENDGSSLQRVRPIDQVEDADLDVAPTLGRADGSGVVVAVIDSGVDFSHADLARSSWSNADEECGNGIDDDANGYVDDCKGWDFGNGDPTSYDPGANPHGTHVAGIITANRNGQGVAGIAPGALIMDLNVGTRSAAGEAISGASIAAAIRYAVDNGADVINLSLGTEPGTPAEAVAPMGAAIDHAASHGVIVVAAAGNQGIDIASNPVYPASFNRPNMLVVGASTPSDTKADFSNHSAEVVDLYAPGALILSTMPGDSYQFMSGTSQASPTTAASVALAIESEPDAPMSQVIDTVLATVDRKETLSTSTTSGRLNSARAIGIEDESSVPTALDVAVSGLREPGNDVSATVEIATPPDAFDEPYRWELMLVHSDETGAYAVIDHPVTIAGSAQTTGDSGTVELLGAASAEEVGVQTIDVATQLPAGRYSFVMEAVPTDDPAFRLGDAFITSFSIAGDGDGDESIPITTAPATTRPEATTSPTDSSTGDDVASGGTGDAGSTTDTEATSTTSAGDQTGSPTGGGNSGPATTTPGTNGTVGAGDGGGSSGGSGGDSGGAGSGGSGGGSVGGGGTDTGSSTPTGSDGSPSTTRPSTGDTGSTGGSGGGSTTAPEEPDTAASEPSGPPPGLGSGEAKKGAWESTGVSPQDGPAGAANTVVIVGNFPSATYVWFGDLPGQVVVQNRNQITVKTPTNAAPGIVDITLRKSRRGVVLTIPDAYAFTGSDDVVVSDPGDPTSEGPGSGDSANGGGTGSDGPEGGDSSSGDGVGSDGSDGDDSSSGDGGGSDGSTGGGAPGDGAGSDDDGNGSTGTDGGTAASSDRRARMAVGSPVELANGLVGGPITPNLASGVRSCSTDPCPAVRR